MSYPERYAALQAKVEQALDACLPLPSEDWAEEEHPRRLAEAMRYSVLNGGKRLRPVLLLAACGLLESDLDTALPFAAAVEMIHCYSLIHDDLPAMDDDDLRRGKPTNHKVYGEAMAILAGDALLNLAYETMAASPHPRAMAALYQVARRAGGQGMIAGQTADIMMEGQAADPEMLRYMHSHKTADLITAPIAAGLTLAGADTEEMAAGCRYGYHLGLAFQIVDDLLDLTGDAALLGKATNMDAQRGKLTWPAVVGMAQAWTDAAWHIEQAVQALSIFDERADFLRELAVQTLDRVQ